MTGVCHAPGFRRSRQLASFAGIDRDRGAAEARILAQSDFDEDHGSAVEHHQVEFAERIACVAFKQAQSGVLQQGAGGVFRRRAQGLPINGQKRFPCAGRVLAPGAAGRR